MIVLYYYAVSIALFQCRLNQAEFFTHSLIIVSFSTEIGIIFYDFPTFSFDCVVKSLSVAHTVNKVGTTR